MNSLIGRSQREVEVLQHRGTRRGQAFALAVALVSLRDFPRGDR